MTDKERLEEIELEYSTLTVSSERNGIEYTEVDVNDLVFLIQNSFKQAKRVEELEQQNERYREALEFYANKINYLTFIENGKSNIEHDKGEKARKALEGESDA